MTIPQGPKLDAVLPLETLDHVALAAICVDIAERVGSQEGLLLYGKPLSTRRFESQLRRRRTFLLEGNGLRAHLGCITDYRHADLTVQGVGASDLDCCAELVTEVSPLISCRWVDAEYDHWQNAEDPLEYTTAGRSTEGLAMKSNELPPPLEQMVVDISKNPGRRILRDGYVEAVGHKMWLGPEFFDRVPRASRESLISTSWLKVNERADGILELVAHDHPFADDTTADSQDRLRRLLFPTTT